MYIPRKTVKKGKFKKKRCERPECNKPAKEMFKIGTHKVYFCREHGREVYDWFLHGAKYIQEKSQEKKINKWKYKKVYKYAGWDTVDFSKT